jgi:hypothetical protein
MSSSDTEYLCHNNNLLMTLEKKYFQSLQIN